MDVRGTNLQETVLKPSNVTLGSFGKLAFRNVDGNIYAQPLIVTGARIANHQEPVNIAIVATEHNSVYAFDTDDLTPDLNLHDITKKALWQTGPDDAENAPLGRPIDYKTVYNAIGAPSCTDLTTEIGITSTPAIKLTRKASPKEGVIFLTAKSLAAGQYSYKLFSLNLADGKPLNGNGTTIKGQVNIGSKPIVFNAMLQLNRPALLLDEQRDLLYIAFGSHCDAGNYRGWLFAYDVSDPSRPRPLNPPFATTFSPRVNNDEGRGAIWMSGYGPALDSDGSIFFVTGDGTYDVTNASFRQLADSVVKVKLVGSKITLQDWFAPQNEPAVEGALNADRLKFFDADLGSGGAVLVPNSHLLIVGGKEGRFYLIDRSDMGQGRKQSLQSFQVTTAPRSMSSDGPPQNKGDFFWNIHGTPVVWPGAGKMFAFVMGEEGMLKQYRLIPTGDGTSWEFDPEAPFAQSKESAVLPPSNVPRKMVYMPGGFLTLSGDGTDAASAIVWATMPLAENANHDIVFGVLRAFDASDITKGELWASDLDKNDGLGEFAKYNPPVVANGKVYVTTFWQETYPNSEDRTVRTKTQGGLLPALVIYGPKH